jgi:Type IV secretion system pilin
MKKILTFCFSLFVLFGIAPSVFASDTGIAQLAGCSGTDCSACNIVYLANGGIKWLIGILFVVFALLLAIAGVKLVTSGGNHHALDEAKSSFTNAIIGFLIILSAWLIVDTIMRALVGTDANPGQLVQNGTKTGYLFWSQVQCQSQTKAEYIPFTQDAVEYVWPGDPNSPYGQVNVTNVNSCASTPAGNVNCAALEASCRAAGNTPRVDTSNPVDYQVQCIQISTTPVAPISGAGSVGCTGGACVRLTIPCKNSSSCSIAPDMVSRLAQMHSGAGVSGARVTEAMPPTRTHKSACHSNGTCIDYGKAGGMSSAEVIRVINSARSNGLRPVYEVQTQSQKDVLVAAGAPSGSVIVLGNWISAPHFSIYGN